MNYNRTYCIDCGIAESVQVPFVAGSKQLDSAFSIVVAPDSALAIAASATAAFVVVAAAAFVVVVKVEAERQALATWLVEVQAGDLSRGGVAAVGAQRGRADELLGIRRRHLAAACEPVGDRLVLGFTISRRVVRVERWVGAGAHALAGRALRVRRPRGGGCGIPLSEPWPAQWAPSFAHQRDEQRCCEEAERCGHGSSLE